MQGLKVLAIIVEEIAGVNKIIDGRNHARRDAHGRTHARRDARKPGRKASRCDKNEQCLQKPDHFFILCCS